MKKFILLSLSVLLVSCVSESTPEPLEQRSETQIELEVGSVETQEEASKEAVVEKEVMIEESVEEVENYILNTDQSTFHWVGKKVTGQHEGTMQFTSGSVTVDSDDQVVSGIFVVDMHSVNTTDLKGSTKDSMDLHLKGEDFFDVDRFATSVLEITQVTKGQSDNFLVAGDLTIKGITKSITFPAQLESSEEGYQLTAAFSLDRTRWGIEYGSGKFFKGLGNKMIDDAFDVRVDILLKVSS